MIGKAQGKRILALLMSAALLLPMPGAASPDRVYAAETEGAQDASEDIIYESIDIYTAEDLIALADNCYVDSWSENKSVTLKADIDLSGVDDFYAIPVFGGIFDGNGHTISGFKHTGAGYVTGFFRYIESSGLVKGLTLKGNIEGDEEEECIGGLCGVNYGTIRGCTFTGTVKGLDTIGGIVGINEGSGTITGCTVNGRILGNYSTGGVAGINHGVISGSTNRAGINDNTEWVEEDDELGTGIFLSVSISDDEAQLYSGVDAGGIAGYSDGMISTCTNEGTVGYEHSGYNIGGIAGRQAGMVSLCTNSGEVYGRKDVGGIVGQMEPYIEVNEAESLRSAINKLHDVIDKTIDDVEATKNVLKPDVDSLAEYSDAAVDAGDELVGQLTDFVDDNIDQVNAFGDRMEYVLDMLPGVMDGMDAALDASSNLPGILDDLGDDLDITSATYKTTEYQRVSLVTTVGGTLTSDKEEPAEGDTVTVTVTPEQDYRMKSKSLSVKDKNGKKISYTDAGNGSYTFTMPKNNVLVTVEFEHTGSFSAASVSTANTLKGAASEESEEETGQEEKAEESDVSEEVLSEASSESASSENSSEENSSEEDSSEEDSSEEIALIEEASETSSESASGEASSESASEEADSETSSEDGEETVSAALIALSSNLGGTASYTCDTQGVVTITITPYDGYAVNGSPTVKDSKNKKVSVSKKKADGTVYTFNISNSVQPCTVKIKFKTVNKAEAAETALENVEGSADDLSEAVSSIKESLAKIKAALQSSDGTVKTWGTLSDEQKQTIQEELLSLSESLSDILSAGSSTLSALTSLSNVLSTLDISAALDDVKEDIDDATDCLDAIISGFKSASNSVRDIVNYLNAQPDIEFAKLGDDFDTAKESLHDQLKGVSDSLSSLSDNASAYSDVINEDLRDVNDQLNVVFNLLADTMTDLSELDLEQYYEDDIDDETLAELTTGRTDACTNKGVVKGDINVGGVAGSMSIDSEDLEGNAAGSVDFELGSRFITRCAITDSVNEGYVTAKKNGAGGIVGYMNHGVVVDSEGYGSVESTEGSYVGGIAGESHTIIRRCYSLSCVSGVKNVGGIAGYAETLKSCYSMSDVSAENGRLGAIAGQISGYEDIDDSGDGELKVSDNYYVGDDIYGIDNISYTGVAEPITYGELLTVESLPTQFWHLKVIYKIEDTYLGSQEVKYGETLNLLDYPEVPEKEGFYAVWEDVTDQTMSGTLVVEAQYKDNVTVVQSGGDEAAESGGYVRPYALVNEAFTEDTALSAAVITPETLPDRAARRKSVTYEVSLENSGLGEDDCFAVRLLSPDDEASVWAYRDGAWTQLESKVRGQYLQVDMIGTGEMFCLIDEGVPTVWIALGACAAIILLALFFKTFRRLKQKRKKAA
ncbi:MAG: hypothetical protein LUE96_11490 [Lachnospiraceae bacterium]|nr:hypothetical protein [Lachnospiraceae bacterium]